MRGSAIIPAPNIFPSSNVVYLDRDYKKLRSKGLIAYGTLEEAVASHRPGGQAYNKYGPYSADNTPLILGNGVFTQAASVSIDVQYLTIASISGNPKDFYITGSVSGNLISVDVDYVSFYNFRIANTAENHSAFLANGNKANVVWSGILHFSTAGPIGRFISSNGLSGRIEKCRLHAQTGATNGNVFTFIGGTTHDFTMEDYYIDQGPTGGLIIDGAGTVSGRWSRGFVTNSGGGALIALNWSGLIEDLVLDPNGSDLNFLLYNGVLSGTMRNVSGKSQLGVVHTSATFVGTLDKCYLISTGSNAYAVKIGDGAKMRYSTLIGNGTGEAVNGGAVTAEITQCILRKITGDAAGSSVSAAITNSASTPFNVELAAATTS